MPAALLEAAAGLCCSLGCVHRAFRSLICACVCVCACACAPMCVCVCVCVCAPMCVCACISESH
jgi:hypothetical protein